MNWNLIEREYDVTVTASTAKSQIDPILTWLVVPLVNMIIAEKHLICSTWTFDFPEIFYTTYVEKLINLKSKLKMC